MSDDINTAPLPQVDAAQPFVEPAATAPAVPAQTFAAPVAAHPHRRAPWWAWTLMVIGALLVVLTAARLITGLHRGVALREFRRGVVAGRVDRGWYGGRGSGGPGFDR